MLPGLRPQGKKAGEFELIGTCREAISGLSSPLIQAILSRLGHAVEPAVGMGFDRNFIKILFANILAWVGCEWLPKANRRTLN